MNAAPETWLAARERCHAQALAAVGQPVASLETPALVIDLDAMERNLQRMASFARAHGLRLRPHAKTHKSAELARQQMALGAVGVCVQKTDEALALAHAGVTDVYISNEVLAESKLARLAQAVRELPCRFALAVDSLLGIERLAAALAQARVEQAGAIDVFVEIDVGHGRCGASSPEEALLLAHQIQAHPTLRLAGLQAYHGGAQHLRTAHERDTALAASADAVRETMAQWQAAGLQVPLITGAGTGTLVREAGSGLWGELQAGSYLFMDADYAANEGDPGAPVFEHALFVKAQVISRGAHHAVCDAGHKSHAIDSGLPTVASPPGLQFANGGDEHGLLRAAAPEQLPALGDTVWLVPGHCDPTVNLHDFYVGVRGGLAQGVIERIIPIDARGAIR
ncbi:DSD1 family PLP-dependent enzyme [Hydrogenophaga sp. PAMC20947]|uniref:DSD1 family PLP-dependent enzyme n=1 Tax=Hydrogenophaga sp. PAMC20947 TaxID=2565558 RepID=UPI00109DC678|nr:DSD1 family PLP-dependent enzyme [Hydrogenophaga sp. PAMC20947]QCB46994.1 DSD1 family PLP-dependent enzyme [Hydrogenophaga sp. PAMC20947]